MAGRIESETKKTAFIEACENLNTLKVVPEKLLQAQQLADTLQRDEIDMTMLYKCGCPCEWIEDAIKQCGSKKKTVPRYSNECTECWLYNLTDEVELNDKEYDIQKTISQYEEYRKFGLEPSQIGEILTCLGWQEINDYWVFIDTIQEIFNNHNQKGS